MVRPHPNPNPNPNLNPNPNPNPTPNASPNATQAAPPRFVLDWTAMRQAFNFDLLLCLGGANMIGQGTIESGLAAVIAEQLARIQGPYLGYVATILCVTR